VGGQTRKASGTQKADAEVSQVHERQRRKVQRDEVAGGVHSNVWRRQWHVRLADGV